MSGWCRVWDFVLRDYCAERSKNTIDMHFGTERVKGSG